jgi:uncharacterized integral membrane protein
MNSTRNQGFLRLEDVENVRLNEAPGMASSVCLTKKGSKWIALYTGLIFTLIALIMR